MLLERHHATTEFIEGLTQVEHGAVSIGHLVGFETGLDTVETKHGQGHGGTP